jgi:putative DNA primase/helicase
MKFIEHLRSLGFEPKEFVLDGKIKRFGRGTDRHGKPRDKNAWYIGWVHHSSRTGTAIEVVSFGDWVTREKYEWKSAAQVSREDAQIIAERMKNAAIERQDLEEELHEAASLYSEELWKRCTERMPSRYLESKGIRKLHGARTAVTYEGRATVVPMRDISGHLWGLQTIHDSGRKPFLKGQRVLETMHFIGEDRSSMIVCEGFATGCSLHEATGRTVVVAFNTANIAEVAVILRRANPDAEIIIAGDDDREQDGNPGKTAAEEAGRRAFARVVLPSFKSIDGNPTDFNDLAMRETLLEVRRQVLPPTMSTEAAAPAFSLRPLGYTENHHVYFTTAPVPRIIRLSPGNHTRLGLMNIAPESYWEALYPGKQGADYNRAADDLMEKSRARGRYEAHLVRGSGAWREEGRLVLNLGTRIEGKPAPGVVYCGERMLAADLENPLSVDEAHRLVALVSRLNVKTQGGSPVALIGWAVVAPLGGALEWRPHIWITSSASGGKSQILKRVLSPLFGAWKHLVLGWGSSANGIRQLLASDSLPALIDEPETEGEQSAEQVADIVRLARLASHESDAVIVKGSTDGHAQPFACRSCFAMASIRVNLPTDADRRRFTIIELDDAKNSPAQWKPLERDLRELLTPAYAARFIGRTVKLWPVLEANMEIFRDTVAAAATMRLADQMAPLLAGYYLCLSDAPVSTEEARSLVRALGIGDREDDGSHDGVAHEEPEWEEALNHLFQALVSCTAYSDQRSIARLLNASHTNEEKEHADRWLSEVGIRWDHSAKRILIRTSHQALRQMYRGTAWQTSYEQILRRIPGAKGDRAYFHGIRQRVVSIPTSTLRDK